jgi:glycosyltransferase involved in cell wall biosynthesis
MFALHKGLHILVDAVRGLLGHSTQFQVALHGQRADAIYPDYTDILLERAQKNGLPIVDKGPFPPEQIDKVLSELDAVIIPSVWQENLPITLLHARSTRTPVIATRVDGIAEFIKTGIEGFLVTPGNTTSLAERMETLMTDDKVRTKLAGEVVLPIGYREHLEAIEGIYAR